MVEPHLVTRHPRVNFPAMLTIARFLPLLTAAGILLAGNGLLGTLMTLRAAEEGFSSGTIGIMGAAYFAGFLLACALTPRLVQAVGHIRVFAALAAVTAAASLALSLLVDPIFWIVVRFAAGFCFSGLFTTVESWINEGLDNEHRAQTISIYRLVDLLAVTGSQYLLPVFGVSGHQAFSVAAILFCLSLVPIALSSRSKPTAPASFSFDLPTVWRLSPLACLGCIAIGLTNSAFRLVGPIYGREMNLDIAGVATFMSAGILGGAVLQFPLGLISDKWGRRPAVILASFGAVAAGLALSAFAQPGEDWLIFAGAFFFGAFAMPLYSLSAAHANDMAQSGQYVLVAAGLMFFYSIGAIIGPFAAAQIIGYYGAPAFFAYTSAVHIALIAVVLIRIVQRPTVPAVERGPFVALLRTSPVIFRLMRRSRTNGETDGGERESITDKSH